MGFARLEKVWPQWKIGELLGEGSFGKVYKAVREEHGLTAYAAIKVISIPQNESELNSLRSEGWSEGATRTYLEGIVNDFINEIKVMESLKGTQNIVGADDFQVLEKEDKVGWDIFIRMELLTGLVDYTLERKLTEDEVIKVGTDILGALELCSKKNIIHRDIKPENIFISSFGHYKLGDFGIARELEKTTGNMSQKGTFNYIAPEVFAGKSYDATADIYSLGIVLYRLMNNNRLPFINPLAEMVYYQERKDAVDKRVSGESLPLPAEASYALAQVILKACAFNPIERYQSAEEFRQALEAVKFGQAAPVSQANPQKSRKTLFVAVCVLLLALVGAGGFVVWNLIDAESPVSASIVVSEYRAYDELAVASDETGVLMDTDEMYIVLSRRLDYLRSEFLQNYISYSVAQAELSAIRSRQIPMLDSQIIETENFIYVLNNSRIVFQQAESQFEQENFIDAINNFQLVSAYDPNFSEAMERVNRAIDAFRENALSEAAGYATIRNFTQAIAVLDNTRSVLGDDVAIIAQKETYREYEITEKISFIVEQSNNNAFARLYMDAIRYLDEGLLLFPDDVTLALTRSYIETLHVQSIVSQAAMYFDDRQFDAALLLLDEGLRIYTNNIMLTNTLNELLPLLPVPLNQVAPHGDHMGSVAVGDVEIGAMQFNNALIFFVDPLYSDGANLFSEHSLDGRFSILTGYIGFVDDSSHVYATVVISGDNRELFVIGLIPGEQPSNISLPVEGVQVLRIDVSVEYAEYYERGAARVSIAIATYVERYVSSE